MKTGVACAFSLFVLNAGAAFGQGEIDLRGFVPGSTFAEAKEHAASAGLALQELSGLPCNWVVNGTDSTLFVCNDRVATVSNKVAGGIDEFAAQVSEWTTEFGAPTVGISSFHAGPTLISNIDARFAGGGSTRIVQLSSTAGAIAIYVSVGSNMECPDVSIP